jgi:thiamine monophosphate synthase
MLLKNDINAIASISSIFDARNIKNATQQFCKILERKSYG